MVGKARGWGRGKGKATSSRTAVPDVYQDMLAEALPSQTDLPERPPKRRKTARISEPSLEEPSRPISAEEEDGEEDVEFEDVLDQGIDDEDAYSSAENTPQKLKQTIYRDSDENSDNSDFDWEAVDFDSKAQDEPSGDLELTLTKRATPRQPITPRRKAATKEERNVRLQIHKMHVLCLLTYVDRRNAWCNDSAVQESLKPLVKKKLRAFLRPREDLSAFGKAESLKKGLAEIAMIWRQKFTITERGLRRPLWAENENDLENAQPAEPADSCLDKSDFRAAAKVLKGSRDVGAQLYCALLRSVGVEARLVCSVQPLSFNSGGPPMRRNVPKPKAIATSDTESLSSASNTRPLASAPVLTPRQRLGHPNAADYNIPDMRPPVVDSPAPKIRDLNESRFPIFWVEVLDTGHNKWLPVDPLVLNIVGKPQLFEPPASDRDNNMNYVIAFEEEGSARDVTRRYTKAYNAKTRKNRVEITPGGAKWWKRTLKAFSRGWSTELDEAEDNELVAFEAREPMPNNIQDFRDHPVYALERHLRRNEVLVPGCRDIGKIAAGRNASVPGQKKLENVYRRKDVRSVKSADAWYRLGRDVKMGEQPIKTVAAKAKPDNEDIGEEDDSAGTNLYSEEQTQLYEPPPIVNGRVPKNSFGNIDIFTPTMVPQGGVHIPHDEAARAARLLGIDYSDALTGFDFRGRHGTAVLKGVVVASEYHAAVEAIVSGYQDERAQAEEERKTMAVLRMWALMLKKLRIKELVDGYAVEGEDVDQGGVPSEQEDDGLDMESEEYVIENDEDDDDMAGGFFPE